MWRKGWVPAGTTEATPLCNACGLLCAPRPPRVPAHAPRGSFFVVFVRFFKRSASSRLRFPVFETRAFPSRLRRDASPPRAPRSGAATDRHPLPPGRALTLGRAIAPRVVLFRHRYKRGWFCSWCTTVYRKPEEEEEPRSSPGAAPAAKLWVGCDRCDRWSHLSCELANDPACLGRGREVAFAEASRSRGAEDDGTTGGDRSDPRTTTRRAYHCPSCRARDRGDAVDADRDPSWVSSPLSRAAGATRAAFGVVAHYRPYLRERERVARGAETHAETHAETRKRERRRRGRDAPPPPPPPPFRHAPRAKRARAEPRSAPTLKEKMPPEPKPRTTETPRSAETPSEESRRGICEDEDSMIAASILGSAFGSAENAVSCGVPKAARTFRGRPRAARAGAAAAALEAAEAKPMTAATAHGPTDAPPPRVASLTARAAADDAKAGAADAPAAHEDAGLPTASPAAPAVAAAPEARSPPPAAPPAPPLRGGMGSPRGLRLLRASAQGAPPLCPARGGGSAPDPAPAPCDPNAGTLRGVNAFVAGGVRPGGSMLVRLLADSLGCGPRSASAPSGAVGARGGARAPPPPEAPADATARATRARIPARSSSSALAAAPGGSANFADGTAPKRALEAPPSAPRRVGGVFVSTLSKEDKRREAAETFPFPPPRSGLEPASCRDKEDVLLDDADADPWGLGCNHEWSDAIDWGDSV